MNAAVPSAPEAPVGALALPDDQVDGLFSRLTAFSHLALAVSGGADSLCLMVLARDWQRRTGFSGRLDVLCVDHGLRTESASEAAFVAARATELGLSCKLLRWDGPGAAGNLQEQARLARYRLMAGHMAMSGAQALVLAHHLDDQAETFLDRLTRGSGVAGLGAMAADEPEGPFGLRLLRPLLDVPKARLEASLRVRGLDWCRDPSNHDPKYKRSRLRKVLTLLEAEGLSAERLAMTAANLRRAGEAIDDVVDAAWRSHVEEHPAGPLRLTGAAYRLLAGEIRLRLLARMIARAGAEEARPRLRQLSELDLMLSAEPGGRRALGGVLFDAGPEWITCWREPGRRPPETIRGLSAAGIWDGRYEYCLPGTGDRHGEGGRLLLGPLRSAPEAARALPLPEGWPRAAFDCAPVIWTRAGEILLTPLQGPCAAHPWEDLQLVRLANRSRLTGSLFEDGAA